MPSTPPPDVAEQRFISPPLPKITVQSLTRAQENLRGIALNMQCALCLTKERNQAAGIFGHDDCMPGRLRCCLQDGTSPSTRCCSTFIPRDRSRCRCCGVSRQLGLHSIHNSSDHHICPLLPVKNSLFSIWCNETRRREFAQRFTHCPLSTLPKFYTFFIDGLLHDRSPVLFPALHLINGYISGTIQLDKNLSDFDRIFSDD